MQIYNELNENYNLSLALGFFDGVHLGHQQVIKSAVKYAKKNNTKSAVITFKDHPCCYFYKVKPKYILARDDRRAKIAELGVDYLYEIPFDSNISRLNAEEYLKDVIIKYFKPESISTGFNHFFGANKSGNAEFLRNKQDEYDYKYFEIPQISLNNEVISSTAIRTALQNGNITKANTMLGYNFKVSGEIIEGQKLGRTLGFKTANIEYPKELINLPFGVYEVKTNYGRGITNYGIRPTVSNKNTAILETHILNFDKDIYGENIDVEFIKMIRGEQKFNSLEDLKSQIKSDIASI